MYSTEIIKASKELTAREKIMLKDAGNIIGLDKACANGSIEIKPSFYGTVKITEEETGKEFTKIVIIDATGKKYGTGSESFRAKFELIADEMGDEEFSIEAYKLPSKNYNGSFITCSLL